MAVSRMPVRNKPAEVPPQKVVPSTHKEIERIRKKFSGVWTEARIAHWLDTGSTLLNSVFGSEAGGIPYGKLIEISGFQSHGKTALTLELMRYAQRNGAYCLWLDLENSWDPMWAVTRGVDPEGVVVFTQEVDAKSGELITVEKLCARVEQAVASIHAHDPEARFFVGVDSVAAMLTEIESAGGLDFNMRAQMSLPLFLSKLCRRWNAFAQTHNMMVVFINQIRTKPGVAYGDPEYTPGGHALPFYCAVRVSMRRTAGGKVLDNGGKQVGVQGTLTNKKNKAGGGSREGAKIGFKIFFAKDSSYVPFKEIKREDVKKGAHEDE